MKRRLSPTPLLHHQPQFRPLLTHNTHAPPAGSRGPGSLRVSLAKSSTRIAWLSRECFSLIVARSGFGGARPSDDEMKTPSRAMKTWADGWSATKSSASPRPVDDKRLTSPGLSSDAHCVTLRRESYRENPAPFIAISTREGVRRRLEKIPASSLNLVKTRQVENVE